MGPVDQDHGLAGRSPLRTSLCLWNRDTVWLGRKAPRAIPAMQVDTDSQNWGKTWSSTKKSWTGLCYLASNPLLPITASAGWVMSRELTHPNSPELCSMGSSPLEQDLELVWYATAKTSSSVVRLKPTSNLPHGNKLPRTEEPGGETFTKASWSSSRTEINV